MKTDDCEILFRRIKDVALTQPYRSERFKKEIREHSGKETFHHVYGSLGSLKSTDLLGVGLTAEEHYKIEYSRDDLVMQIPQSIANLLWYVKKLEKENKILRIKGRL